MGILGPPGNHASRWIRDLWSKGVSLILAYFETFLSFCVLDDFFHFSKKLGFGVFLVHPMASVLLSASVKRCFVSRMRDFLYFFVIRAPIRTHLETQCLPYARFSKHRPSGPMLSISRNVRLYICLFTFEVPFNGLFAPTSRSQMSNIFTDSESLGKSNGKKWSQI